MYRVRTNCLGCHTERKVTDKSQIVMAASGKTCVHCHTKDHDKMVKDWKTDLHKGIKETIELEKETLELLSEKKAKLPKAKLAEARKMLTEGRDILEIIRFGNGVHNKKYSMFLLDAAITKYEDLLDMLEEHQ
jgi:hypothetical protein